MRRYQVLELFLMTVLFVALSGCSDGSPPPPGELEHWTKLLGVASEFTTGMAIATDDTYIYVAGDTSGNLSDGSLSGRIDAYIAKYDLDGNRIWLKQLGAVGADTHAEGIAVDSSGIYIAGYMDRSLSGQVDAFVAKYDKDGNW